MPLTAISLPVRGYFLHLYIADALAEQAFLAEGLPAQAMQEYLSIRLEKRRWEWLAGRLLLEGSGLTGELSYAPSGKPYLEDGPPLSLTHGHGCAALITGAGPCGVDLQGPDDKLFRIREKFCSPPELDLALNTSDPLETLAILWTAKEAVFKTFGENVHFARDIRVHWNHGESFPSSASCHRPEGLYSMGLSVNRFSGHLLTCAWIEQHPG